MQSASKRLGSVAFVLVGLVLLVTATGLFIAHAPIFECTKCQGNSTLRNTGGTAPEAGIDFEPNEKDEYLTQCVVRKCTFTNNAGYGLLFALHNIGRNPVSIQVENCTGDKNKLGSLWVLGPKAVGRITIQGGDLKGKPKLEHGTDLKVEGVSLR